MAVENKRLKKQLVIFASQIRTQAFKIERLTQYSRRENVRPHGVYEAATDDTHEVAIDIIWNMGVRIAHDDNIVRHRQPKSRATRERPIVGKFIREEEPRILRDKKTRGC